MHPIFSSISLTLYHSSTSPIFSSSLFYTLRFVPYNTIVFLGVIEIETFEDLKTAIRFLFSGIYDSQNFLIQHGSTFAKSEIVNLLERALLPIKNRYGENQDVIISMSSICQHKKDIMVLYPYGGTDFGSFMLFVV